MGAIDVFAEVNGMPLADAAARFAAAGVPVFPCVPGEKRPLVSRGFHDASTDREQVEGWKPLHESLTKLNEAQERRHEKQVEKLTKERDESRKWAGAQAKLINKQEQQLAALAEQNEKLRKVLLRLACLGNGDQYGNSIGNCIAQEALSLPDLASPVLNRIRAEALNKAAKWFNDNVDNRTDTWQAQELRRMAAELEKTNNVDAAAKLGTVIAKKALDKGITTVVFDRGGFIYAGKVKALAEAAREAGLEF